MQTSSKLLLASDRYPLMPNVVAGIAGIYVSRGDDGAAIDYLSAVLDISPDNEEARRVLREMGVDPTE